MAELQGKNWRKKESTFLKKLINQFIEKKALYEVDIKKGQRKLLTATSPEVATQVDELLREKKHEYQGVCDTLQSAEDLLVEYEKDEAKLVN